VSRRGQLVLLAAALIAVALAPIVFASLQLGYHDDVAATADYEDPTADALRVLDRAVATASSDVPGEYRWRAREAAVDDIRSELRPRIDRLQTASVERGTLHEISYNGTAAGEWATDNCPGGPARQFGNCERDRGVVVQERTGWVHVVAVGFDVRTTTDRGTTTVTVVVRPIGGRVSA
jgi:hypothetical protein